MKLSVLPIDALLLQIKTLLRESPSLVIEAAPGAGKTTRVPPLLLDCVEGDVLVLEPRRIAARLAARRVAAEKDETIGETVGYQVRFEDVSGPNTRLMFVTEGVLNRRFLSDPMLSRVGAVVLDEFHERHLDSDLALALLKDLQKRRSELRIVVMSATLDAAPISRFLDDCPILRSEGRQFPLAVRHTSYSNESVEQQVSRSLGSLLNEGHSGNILVFLPGVAEIRRAMCACDFLAQQYDVLMLPLHGGLSPEEQDKAIAPMPRQKVIFATNVAESSVTVDGVTAVIDSGLARIASYSAWSGLPTLRVGRISKASAIQRGGRAGRIASGQVIRLYPEDEYQLRPEHDSPEIERADLSQLCLFLRAAQLGEPQNLQWLTPPPVEAIEHANSLLDRFGATSDSARALARYPLQPRLARILEEAVTRGVGDDGCHACALLDGSIRVETNDLLEALDTPPDGKVLQNVQQLRRIARVGKQSKRDDDALLISMLAGFPDRVARKRSGNQVQLSSGISVEVTGTMPRYEFMVVIDAEDRKEQAIPVARMVSRIEPEWLIDLFPERIREECTLQWNRSAERVETIDRLRYDELILQESHSSSPDPAKVSEVLIEKAMEYGLERFVDKDALYNLSARIRFADLPPLNIKMLLQEFCTGMRSFSELRAQSQHLLQMLESSVDTRRLNEFAPSSLRLGNGRQTKVHYELDKSPWIASRLQDFFGMRETPRVGPDRLPVVAHLLAPNQRAVQMTTDLPGFWERLYPQVRRELMRRYPRHAWPERP